jgi:general secretion pathway protein D
MSIDFLGANKAMRLASLGFFLLLAASSASAAAVVSAVPGISSVGLGGTFTLAVEISDVTDLYAYQLDVNYDPAVLAAQSVAEDTFLAQGGSTIFVAGTIDNSGGSVANNGDSLDGFVPGVTGSGVLLDIVFQGVDLGHSDLDLANVELLDSNFDDIPFTLQSGAVDVTAPEPSAALLMAAAGLYLAARLASARAD